MIFLRTVNDFLSVRTVVSRIEKVVNHEEYCLFSNAWIMRSQLVEELNSQGPACLCLKCLWTFLLGHTMTLWLLETRISTGHLYRLKGGLSYNWINLLGHMQRGMDACLEAKSCTCWLQYSLPNQQAELGSPATDTGWSFLKAKSLFFSPVGLARSLHCCGCHFPES